MENVSSQSSSGDKNLGQFETVFLLNYKKASFNIIKKTQVYRCHIKEKKITLDT